MLERDLDHSPRRVYPLPDCVNLDFFRPDVLTAEEIAARRAALGIPSERAVVVYLGINTYLNYINKKGQGAYNTAYYDLMARMSEKGEAEDLKEPEELFQKVMAEYGRSKVSRLAPPQVAFLKYRDKKYDEAIALYLRFIEDVPQNSPYRSLASVALAACYEEKGELEKAIEGLKAVISGPDDFFKEQAMLSLARVYTLSNQTEKARDALKKGLANASRYLELNPDDARALYMKAIALAVAGEREQAFEWLERALSIDPEDPMIVYGASCVYAVAGREEAARLWVLNSSRQSPYQEKENPWP